MNNYYELVNLINYEEPVKDDITATLEHMIARQISNIRNDINGSILMLEIFVNSHLIHNGGVQHE